MTIAEFKKRLKMLEARFTPDAVYVLVQDAEGEEREVTIEEWYQSWQTMKFLKFTKGFDPEYHDVKLLLRAIDEAAAEAANEQCEEQTKEH